MGGGEGEGAAAEMVLVLLLTYNCCTKPWYEVVMINDNSRL